MREEKPKSMREDCKTKSPSAQLALSSEPEKNQNKVD